MRNPEEHRLSETDQGSAPWKKWGPYLSERQWGTVREDYSENGAAWDYFTHDQARSRAYKWGEDGLAGISDDHQQLCFALALWNGVDPIIKERLFGLPNSQANHGEDVKEVYFYLDSTPTHSYMKYLYKYPQAAFPYDQLVKTNSGRTRAEMEFELIDTGIFDQDRYFDVFVEYAKAGPEDLLIQITAWNRGPQPATLHILPHLWFRNTWWKDPGQPKPELRQVSDQSNTRVVQASHPQLGEYSLYVENCQETYFTQNETNTQRLFNQPNQSAYVKDGINDTLVDKAEGAVNPEKRGTKAAALFTRTIAPGESQTVRLRLCQQEPVLAGAGAFDGFAEIMAHRRREADHFYDSITPPGLTKDQRSVMRQALAGMMWTKQFYYFDVDYWLYEHAAHPLKSQGNRIVRNRNWFHMVNEDIISMPDKWEYPWYAAWDLAFHTVALNMVDTTFAREQLSLMLEQIYQHPNGQIPAYEWNFSDVNPPVHAFATLLSYAIGRQNNSVETEFLKSAYQKLVLNFNWWINRKDPNGRNVFEGGFLGLDNIGVFDRSSPLPTGGNLEQADGTAWMAMYCQNMFEISLVLAMEDPIYEDMALRFLEHFFLIASAMDRIGDQHDELWDEQDGFFYDLLRLPNENATRLKVRSTVGLLPLCATAVLPGSVATRFPNLTRRVQWRFERSPELLANVQDPREAGYADRRLFAVVNERKLRRILEKMLDEQEFLSPYGIRSLSKVHAEHPYVVDVKGQEFRVDYLPAESNSGMFGGNSNWRGPIWFPTNLLIIRSLLQFFIFYGKEWTIECPTGSGNYLNLYEVSEEIARRLTSIFIPDQNGRRPVYGGTEKFQSDPHWKDYILFYEYFHGDNGAGLGASHQTGWTGLVAKLIQFFASTSADEVLESGVLPLARRYQRDVTLSEIGVESILEQN
jgi:hypothetical protein